MGVVELTRSGDRVWRIGMINGPNMPNLGKRDANFYGAITMEQLDERVRNIAAGLGAIIQSSVCSNYEGDILTWIHAEHGELDGIIINPAGLTPYGEATRHALEDTGLPVIEMHFANTAERGRSSIFTSTVVGICMGLHKHSYTAALVGMVCMLDDGDFKAPVLYHERQKATQRND